MACTSASYTLLSSTLACCLAIPSTVALQDPDVQYIKILPLCQVTLHVLRVLHFSAFHFIRTTCIARKEGTLEELLACLA